jgi:hypothetical protein
MPAAQREVAIGEIRFTLPFGGTITIAATSATSSTRREGAMRRPVTGPEGRRTWRTGWSEGVPKSVDPADNQNEIGKARAGRQLRGLSEQRSGELDLPGKHRVSRERGRRRTRQDQISIRALGPVKLRISLGGPHRTKKTCFFCRIGLKELPPSKDDPAV